MSHNPLSSLQRQLAGRSILDITTVEIEQAYQTLVANSEKAEVRIAWLGNHTLDPVVRGATVAALSYELQISCYVGAFDQYFQIILDKHSEIYVFDPHVIVLWLSMRGLCRDLLEGGAGLSEADRLTRVEKVLEQVQGWVKLAEEKTKSTLFLCNFPRPPASRLGLADMRFSLSEAKLFTDLNLKLAECYRNNPRVFLVDVDNAIAAVGRRSGWNPRLYRLAKIEWSAKAANAAADLLARSFRALYRPAKKCLVVDLDNTLWGGIVGEDGPEGIRVDEGDPIGECFQAFQWALIDLKARGILLAICSKNNLADVEEVFEHRVNMPLHLKDFAAKQINWNPKHENIRAIADDLNIGLESMIFVDDNPMECALIQQILPEVKTIHLPQDPAEYADLILDIPDFDKLVLTEEDRQKTEQYHANAARKIYQVNTKDMDSYLESLGMTIQICEARTEHLIRVHQLFSKTNQFNTTTRRYNPIQIQEVMENKAFSLQIISAQDNFGDLGVIGLYLLQNKDEIVVIDSFILSCRALGRNIETAMCNWIKEQTFSKSGTYRLSAKFIPTKKNMPCANFYDREGFKVVNNYSDGSRDYEVHRTEWSTLPCPSISVRGQAKNE